MINSRSSVIAVQKLLLRKRYGAAVGFLSCLRSDIASRLHSCKGKYLQKTGGCVSDPKVDLSRRDWVTLWENSRERVQEP